ncbi:hypothetical protein [Paracidovorax cattleyae]|uniref:hypothetical protein n=1 Tax=Paracidovorax cattleyae TaxID=80868 RepID=UPI00115FE423|nr:hypothetical protein [Paracidovorax cattleyae]
MIKEHTISTPPFLTQLYIEELPDQGQIFIKSFIFRVSGILCSSPEEAAVLGTYALDLEQEISNIATQDPIRNTFKYGHISLQAIAPHIANGSSLLGLLKSEEHKFKVLNGPEFFDGYEGYLIKYQDHDIFFGGEVFFGFPLKAHFVQVPSGSYEKHAQKTLAILRKEYSATHQRAFTNFIDSNSDNFFISETAHEHIPLSAKKIIASFFIENNLLRDSKNLNRRSLEIKFSDLNELGWAVSQFANRKWIHTKTTRSGNPDVVALKRELENIKKRLGA